MSIIFEFSSKQLGATSNTIIKTEKVYIGCNTKLILNKVMIYSSLKKFVILGTPFVYGIRIEVRVLGHEKDKKLIIFKKKRRQNYRIKKGYRHQVTFLQIQSISLY